MMSGLRHALARLVTHRHTAVLATGILASGILAACTDVRSLEPAIDSAHAIESAGLPGRWTIPDSAVLDIARLPGNVAEYRVRVQDLTDSASGTMWLRGRVGRLGGRLAIEVTPDFLADSALEASVEPYQDLLQPVYMVYGLDVRPEELRVAFLLPDTSSAKVRALLERRECASPHRYLSRQQLLLTGSSAAARAAYDCLVRAGALADSGAVFRRAR